VDFVGARVCTDRPYMPHTSGRRPETRGLGRVPYLDGGAQIWMHTCARIRPCMPHTSGCRPETRGLGRVPYLDASRVNVVCAVCVWMSSKRACAQVGSVCRKCQAAGQRLPRPLQGVSAWMSHE
jgi:hypothetical protein